MLDILIERMPHVAALFCTCEPTTIPQNIYFLVINNFIRDFSLTFVDDKNQKKSQKVLVELENIDDECDQNDIAFVKIDDLKEAQEYGVTTLPQLIFFEKHIPHVYEGRK